VNRQLWRYLVVPLALLVVVAGLGLGQPPAVRASDGGPYAKPVKTLDEALTSGRIEKETLDGLAARGTATIVARLRLPTPFVAEGSIGGLVDQQRQNIAAVQQRVVQQLASGRIAHVKRFRTIPHLAVELDAAGLTALVAMPEVEIILPDRLMSLHLATSVPALGADGVQNVYGNASTGAGQAVAILDSGVDSGHPFLGGRVVSQACYSTDTSISDSVCPAGVDESTASNSGEPCINTLTNCDHGTHVAGIVGGNGAGLAPSASAPAAGVAPAASIISIKIFSKFTDNQTCQAIGASAPCLLAHTSDVVRGLERAYDLRNTYSIAAVNLSLGGGRYTTRAQCELTNRAYVDVIQNLTGAGIATVASSGNGALLAGGGFRTGLASPACLTQVVSVGATNGPTPGPEQVWALSQTMGFLTLLAPGLNINSSVPGGSFGVKSGTSQAAPHVAGAIAALRSIFGPVGGGFAPAMSRTGIPITDTRGGMNLVTPRLQLDAAAEDLRGSLLPPTDLSMFAATASCVSLIWVDNSRGETGFAIEHKERSRLTWLPSGSPPQNTDYWEIPGLAPATDYQFRIKACGSAGCSTWSDVIDVTTFDSRPCVPRNFRVTSATTTSLAVAWDVCPSSNPLNEFHIRTNATPSQAQVTRAYNLSARSATFSNLSTGVGHYFYISACNQYCSPESPMLWGVTQAPAPPAAPSNLHVCGGSELCFVGGPTLVWRDNASNESDYELAWTSAPPGAVPADPGSATNRTSLPANRTSHQPPGLQSGWTYSYQVRAHNAGGFSTPSNRITFTAP
jgi:subtilisin